MPVIKVFDDGSIIERDQGSFDEWCVYLTRPQMRRHAPKDNDYFQQLKELAKSHTASKLYKDYTLLYELTHATIIPSTLDYISEIAKKYGEDKTEIDILFTILYLGMVAEENKKNTRLGKRIKRLGMHQILIEDIDAHVAANYSRGMQWQQINEECKKRGF